MSLAWVYLIIAGLLEVCWAIGLKYTEGFTKLTPSIFTIVTFSLSMFLLAKATHTLPIGTAYAIWVGIGVLGAVVLGVYFFNEPISLMRGFFVILLIISIIGLKITA
ncbi:MAG: multidrug efflux SMR transporter [Alphaproteobacteria bacterium]|nr:multidrug efflux SMR transporter [Alphaproteobacteria bacterium]MBP7759838.1 multidrug efflux SMR transporter [Alphaproteobacteria bacterium]MBP7762048.1 multidrug efflux SMR transporter [Alphaproteobacteria bacterium]